MTDRSTLLELADIVDVAALELTSGYTDHDDYVAERALAALSNALRARANQPKDKSQ